MKYIVCLCAVIGGFLFWKNGCSQETKDKVVECVETALSNENKEEQKKENSVEQEHETPIIVAEQQKKTIIEQNTKWTPENQKKYPIEYCYAQLEELDKGRAKLDEAIHKILLAKSTILRKLAENERTLEATEKFFISAKNKYIEGEKNNQWPIEINGYNLSQNDAKERIVEASLKLQGLKEEIVHKKAQLDKIEKKYEFIKNEQKRAMRLKERVQNVINDLGTKNVIDNHDSIVETMNALSDSISALDTSVTVPSFDDLLEPSKQTKIDEEFNKIMGK